jgi:O-antigen/teichoic acid export membrane protein
VNKEILRPSGLTKLIAYLKQRIFINAGYIFSVNILPGLIGVVFWAVAGRFYLPSDIGLSVAILSAISLLSVISTLGMNIGVIRFLPQADNQALFLNAIYTFVAIVALITSGIYILGIPFWGENIAAGLRRPDQITLLIVFVIIRTVGNVVQNTFIALRESGFALQYTGLVQFLRIAILATGIWLGADASLLVGSHLVSYLIGLLVCFFVLIPNLVTSFRAKPILYISMIMDLLPYAAGNQLAVIFQQIQQLLFPLIILEFLGSDANGYAYMALMLGAVITSPAFALINSAFAEGANMRRMGKQILLRTSKQAILLSAIISLLVLLLSPYLLSIFGYQYVESSSLLLRFLALAAPSITLNQAYFTQLSLLKQTTRLVWLNVILAVLSVGLCLLTIKSMGILGCGIAVLVANLVLNLMIVYLFRRESGSSESGEGMDGRIDIFSG